MKGHPDFPLAWIYLIPAPSALELVQTSSNAGNRSVTLSDPALGVLLKWVFVFPCISKLALLRRELRLLQCHAELTTKTTKAIMTLLRVTVTTTTAPILWRAFPTLSTQHELRNCFMFNALCVIDNIILSYLRWRVGPREVTRASKSHSR